jgi:hypothetical protein
MINFSWAMIQTSAFSRDADKHPLIGGSGHLKSGRTGNCNSEVGVCLARAAAQQQTGQRERGDGEQQLSLR